MGYLNTKWNKEKVENLMRKYEWVFESADNGYYSDAFVKFYGKKKRMQLYVGKTTISVEQCGRSAWDGITTYKKLEEVLSHYHGTVKNDIWRNLSSAEKFMYAETKSQS